MDWSDFSLPTPSSLKIYDIQTGNKLLTLFNPDLANNYKRNCATFNPTDDLVLNDGVLWDVRSAQAIHKFDKFNMNISGVFHPNGLEVIINTEIVSFAPLPVLPFVYLAYNAEIILSSYQYLVEVPIQVNNLIFPFGLRYY